MKRKIIYISVTLLMLLAIVFTLSKNKKKLNAANTPVDRTHIPISVLIQKAEIKPLDILMDYPATIQPYDEAKLYSEASGVIASLPIELGKRVQKGEIVGMLDTKILEINLKQAQVEAERAQINQQKTLDDYNRAKDLFEHKAGLETNMLTAKNSYQNAVNAYKSALNQVSLINQQIENSKIVSPLSGIISMHNVKQGEFVSPGIAIATVTNISKLKATVFVDQQTTYQLKKEQVGIITSSFWNERQLTGKIIYISPVADANHNYQIDLLVNNSGLENLRGGTDIRVSFQTLSKKEALVIPKSALMTDADQQYVYVNNNEKAHIKKVNVGLVMAEQVEILSGLDEGEQVIISGQINLNENSNLKILKK